ncbi:MAG TPA: ATP-binding protein [Terriglobales bacterium]|nr:ATP-binding protein [Terriglobales bacterium]
MSERSKLWILAAGCLVFAQACASALIPPGFALTVFSDVTQCILLLSATAALLPNITRNQGRTRLFWGLMTLGIVFWLSYQLLWSYIEVVLRQEVPDPFVGDIVIFLHFVPMMAALALQPQAQQNDHEARLGRLDFVLLLTWWVYLYLFDVIPWQYAQTDELAYSRSLNTLYLTEKLVFLVGLVIVWHRSKGGWKSIYAHWFGASVVYALSSYVANWAIQRNAYYTGSLYDLPVAASMGWISVIGVLGQDLRPKQEPAQPAPGRHGVWVARMGMFVILSLPLFAAWSVFDVLAPPRVRNFRLVTTLVTMMLMGGIVFLRQHLLDRELIRLLRTSQESFEDLKHLQAQLIQSEKLASLGQLVGGAAHELNNPLTAMLGYSELLAESGLTEEQRTLAGKIALQVKRTRVLIASLLNFARQVPGEKIPVDANSVVQTAVKLCQPHFSTHKVEVQMNLATNLPQISADPNQLLQVCLHVASNALQALDEVGGGILSVKTRRKGDAIILEFSDNGPGAREPDRVFDPFYTTRPVGHGAGLGLSACYGIIQEHRGLIQCTNRVEGGTTIHIEIPAAGTHLLVAERKPLKPYMEPPETAASLETRPLT